MRCKTKSDFRIFSTINLVALISFITFFPRDVVSMNEEKILIVVGTELTTAQLDSIDGISGASSGGGSKIKTQATSEIAARMQQILEKKSKDVTVVPAYAENIDIAPYDLVIIGTGIYGKQSHSDIVKFQKKYAEALNGKKVAVFAVCGTMGTKNVKNREQARAEYSKTISTGLNPVKVAVFAGTFKDSGAFWNWIGGMALGGTVPGDHRDWEEIARWTNSLVE